MEGNTVDLKRRHLKMMHYLYNKLQYSMNLLVKLHFYEILMHTFIYYKLCAHFCLSTINFLHLYLPLIYCGLFSLLCLFFMIQISFFCMALLIFNRLTGNYLYFCIPCLMCWKAYVCSIATLLLNPFFCWNIYILLEGFFELNFTQ